GPDRWQLELQSRGVDPALSALVSVRIRSSAECRGASTRSARSSVRPRGAQAGRTHIVTDAIGRNVLVTGSAGFIGGYVVEELLRRGYFVVGLDNYSKYG